MFNSLLFVLATGFSYLFQRKCQGCCQKWGEKHHFCVSGDSLLGKHTQQCALRTVLLEEEKKDLVDPCWKFVNLYFLRTNASITEYIFHRGNIAAGFHWVFQYIWSYCKYYSLQQWALSIIKICIDTQLGLSVQLDKSIFHMSTEKISK